MCFSILTTPPAIIDCLPSHLCHVVSSFDPEMKLEPYDLTRLEKLTGIQIESVLNDNVSQLMASIGMVKSLQLYTIGFRGACDIFRDWCYGAGNRPPTWRQLLNVLEDIGLKELSQHIEEFMKGETNS